MITQAELACYQALRQKARELASGVRAMRDRLVAALRQGEPVEAGALEVWVQHQVARQLSRDKVIAAFGPAVYAQLASAVEPVEQELLQVRANPVCDPEGDLEIESDPLPPAQAKPVRVPGPAIQQWQHGGGSQCPSH